MSRNLLNGKGDTTNSKLVKCKDESPSMVDEIARTGNLKRSKRINATRALIIHFADKVERVIGIGPRTPRLWCKRKTIKDKR